MVENNDRYGKISNIKIIQHPVKVLGIWICKHQEELLKLNYDECLNKLKTLLNVWSQRNLTIKGKITLLKSKAVPLIMYICNSLYVSPELITSAEQIIMALFGIANTWLKKTTIVQK